MDKTGLLRPFKHELKSLITLEIAQRAGCYDEKVLDRLQTLFSSGQKKQEDAKEYVYRTLGQKRLMELLKNHPETYEEFLAFLDQVKPFQLHDDVIENLCMFIRADELCKDLNRHFGQTYSSLTEKILRLWLEKHDVDHLACLMVRRIVRKEHWFPQLLIALRESQWHSYLADVVDPDNAATIDLFKAKQRAEQMLDEVGTTAEEIYEESEADLIFRPQQDYEETYAPQFAGLEIAPPIEIALRPYQEELVETAITGKNTIICAPTGSGKTVVASYIMLDHLHKRRVAGENCRIAMMVPTIPLVEQQCTALYVYLRLNYILNGFCGTETVECRAYSALACDVVVFTPQLFLNMLKSPKKTDRLNVSDFTMLVFDECHHCDGEHPYKLLMDIVQGFKGPTPQIIGLTASVGVGTGSNNVENCMRHMLKICVHLSANAVTTVRRCKADLDKHVVPPLDVIERCSRFVDSQFIRRIQSLMGDLQASLENDLKRYQGNRQLLGKWNEYVFPTDKNSLNYQNFLGTLGARIQAIPGLPKKTRFLMMLDILKQYQLALEYNDLLPSRYAKKMLIASRANLKRVETDETYSVIKEFGDHCEQLYMIQDESCDKKKDILIKLRNVLIEQYTKEPESRTLIFVQKRAFAEMMSDYLNGLCAELRCFSADQNVGYVTSTNQSSATGGQSGFLQRQTIAHFNSGIIRILVATSVAEEGLDISTCNLIIKYNNTGSEKTLIQRRGRARAKGSKSVLLALDGSIEANEMAAVQKEDLMKRCMAHLQSFGSSVLEKLIEQKRVEIQKATLRELQDRKELEEQLKSNKYLLVCIKCGSEICDSSTIRKFPHSQYGSVDRDIWSRVLIRRRAVHSQSHMPKNLHGGMDVAQIQCQNESCDQIFGVVWQFSDTFLPVLKPSTFIMYEFDKFRHNNMDGEPVRVKRWLDIGRTYFFIRDCREVDIKNMFGALRAFSEKMNRQLTRDAEQARIVIARKEIEKRKNGRRGGGGGNRHWDQEHELADEDVVQGTARLRIESDDDQPARLVHEVASDSDDDRGFGICG